MKILQILAGAKHGGAETAFVDMCIAMKEAGQDIEVVTRANAVRVPKLQEAGIKVHTLPFGGAIDLFTPFMLERVIKAYKPDIVQTWMSRASQKVRRWHKGLGIPQYHVVSRLGGYYKIKYFENTDYFVTITPDIRRYLIEECGIDADKVRHINNFAETEAIKSTVSRVDYGVPEDASLCLGLGRLHSSKAFDVLIEAVAGLPDVYLWIAGEGPDRAALENLISQSGAENRIKLLGWRNDRAALFDAADVCVFSSRYEPFGTVFVQAWANETPLVTTDSDGPKQFVHHEIDGLITPIDDVESMRAAIKRLINNPELCDKIVENGLQRYESEFTKENSVQAYLNYFKEIKSQKIL